MENPLILVFYIDRETLLNRELVKIFTDSINAIIEARKMNAVAFFLPTDTEERIECINPIVVPRDEMDRINKIITDISNEFSVGGKLTD